MKLEKFLTFIFYCLVLSLCITSCSKDKSNEVFTNNNQIIVPVSEETKDLSKAKDESIVVAEPPVVEKVIEEIVATEVEAPEQNYEGSDEIPLMADAISEATKPVEETNDGDSFYSSDKKIESSQEEPIPFAVSSPFFDEEGKLHATYSFGAAVNAEIIVGDTSALVNYRTSALAFDHIRFFLEGLAVDFPIVMSKIVVDYTAETITFDYPKELLGGKYYKLLTLSYLKDRVDSALEELYSAQPITEDSIEETISEVYDFFGREVRITAGKTKAIIESSGIIAPEELKMATEVLLNIKPELSAATYEVSDNGIIVEYPAVNLDYVEQMLISFNGIIQAYTPMLLEEIPVEEASADIVVEQERETTPMADTAVETLAVEPSVIEKEIIASQVEENDYDEDESMEVNRDRMNLTVGFVADEFKAFGFEFTGSYEHYIKNDFYVGAKVSSTIGVGLKVPVSIYIKRSFKDDFYWYGGLGYSFNVNHNNGILAEGGIGYVKEIEEGLEFFGEGSFSMMYDGSISVTPGLKLGARISF